MKHNFVVYFSLLVASLINTSTIQAQAEENSGQIIVAPPGKEITFCDGTRILVDGSILHPKGTKILLDGNMVLPDGTVIKPQ